MKLGYCPSYAKENIKEVYESYHKLKENIIFLQWSKEKKDS